MYLSIFMNVLCLLKITILITIPDENNYQVKGRA